MDFSMIDNLEHLVNKALREGGTIARLGIAALGLPRVEGLGVCVPKVGVKFPKMGVCPLIT